MNLKLTNENGLPIYEFAAIIALFAIYFLPSVSLGTMTLLALILAYCCYLLLVDNHLFLTIAKPLMLIFVLAAAYALLTDASSISKYLSNRELRRFVSKFYQYLTIYFPAILFVRVNKSASQAQKKYLAFAGIVFMVYVVITTWRFLADNPDATRQWRYFEENSSKGVANYYFIYSVPIIVSVLSIALFRTRGVYKLIFGAFIVVGLIFLVYAQYTLSILIAIIGVIIQIYRNLNSIEKKTIYVFVVAVGAIFLPQILEYVISIVPSEQVSTRLQEVLDFFTGKGAGGYNLNGRLTLYRKSIIAFFESPIWGNRSLDFDGHATFLTVLSDTGILGGIPFYALLATVCRTVNNQIYENRSQFNVVVIMFSMMGMTNPIHASLPLGMVMWFLAPLMIQMLFKENLQNETAVEN